MMLYYDVFCQESSLKSQKKTFVINANTTKEHWAIFIIFEISTSDFKEQHSSFINTRKIETSENDSWNFFMSIYSVSCSIHKIRSCMFAFSTLNFVDKHKKSSNMSNTSFRKNDKSFFWYSKRELSHRLNVSHWHISKLFDIEKSASFS